MPNPSFLGYLNDPYLENPYAGDTGFYAWGMEVNRIIADQPRATASEVARFVNDFSGPRGMQAEGVPTGAKALGMEVFRDLKNVKSFAAMEVNREVQDFTASRAMEVRRDQSMASWFCDELGYLEQPYLEEPYLTPYICAQMGVEVARFLTQPSHRGMEVLRQINSKKTLGMEVLRRIVDYPKPIGVEVDRLRVFTNAMQCRLVIYNTTNLRVLCEFPSRGNGTNWTATSTKAGDFSPNNLNTDIVEQVWRSNNGVTSAILECDTGVPQGIPVDTLALLNHNLTGSATITVQGSNDPGFGTINETFSLLSTATNAYYIAPTFPIIQSRYWRISISDATNPATYLQVGTIIFGTTVIFQGECFTDNVVRRLKHFSDKVATEGFTNVSNDRALKTSVSLDFRFLQYDRGNYRHIREIFETARTSHKCLWIPVPQQVTRFSVFGKLTQIPDETHINMGPDAADNVSFGLEVDESL